MKLPIGIEDFGKIRTEGFYYVDKTGMIRELLNNWGEVNLFTRPRRFGKSLNMNMLKYFFEYGCDASLFDGLAIQKEQGLCDVYMGKYPVISISLKDVSSRTFDGAYSMLRSIIGNEAMRFPFLKESSQLTEEEKGLYEQLVTIDTSGKSLFLMSEDALTNSLFTLSKLLHKHYGQKAILLIDEYDVPLDKAQHSGYYDEMVGLIRNLFSRVLKSNSSLHLAVLTGCLRIARESIFTGLNNLRVLSIADVEYDEYFGFTDAEVRDMLHYYSLDEKYELTKTWYDGYRFGNTDVYCPWDVINYCAKLRADPDAAPRPFWVNTSGNDIILTFLRKTGPASRRELECLINGGTVRKKIRQELTYRDIYQDMDNLWSVLFTTGYLTQCGSTDGRTFQLVIPNLEIREIFTEQIYEWFQKEARKDTPKLDAFCAAFPLGDTETIETLFTAYLKKTISIRDTGARKEQKENFYHGILLGLLSHREDWIISSNAESGAGYSDILIEIEDSNIGIVIELKYPDNGNLETGCLDALAQIEEKEYTERLLQNGMEAVIKYGIACYKKTCKVASPG
ncbi:AAA family ATPase [uncultured Acetatifactor sp.]|uniref:AAA family ATPase n=1 Tax=uncultured Acetatifactor sp. TaxID=1671927 RepID=UPI002ED0E6CD